MLLFRYFFLFGNHYWNYGEPVLKGRYFPACGNHLLQFSCQKKQFFHIVDIVETYFSTNASFGVVETDFLASTNHFLSTFLKPLPMKTFSPSSRNVFLKEFFIFFSIVETVYFSWELFWTSGNRHWYEWTSIFKDRTYSIPGGN